MDHYQMVEIPGYRFRKAAGSRMDQANRRRFPAIVAFPYRRHALSQTAKFPNPFNPTLPSMTFRVQMNRLKPGTI